MHNKESLIKPFKYAQKIRFAFGLLNVLLNVVIKRIVLCFHILVQKRESDICFHYRFFDMQFMQNTLSQHVYYLTVISEQPGAV